VSQPRLTIVADTADAAPPRAPRELRSLGISTDQHVVAPAPVAAPRKLSRAADLLIGLVFTGWLVAAAYTASALSAHDVMRLLPILILTAVVRRQQIGLYTSVTHISLSAVGSLAAGMQLGFAGAVLCSTVAVLAAPRSRGSVGSVRPILFNLGCAGLSNGLAALVFLTCDWAVPGEVLVGAAIGALSAGAVTYISETTFVTLIVALSQNRSPKQVWTENFRWMLPHWMMLGLVGLGLAQAYEAMGIFGVGVFAGPALMMRYTMKQYVDRTMRSVTELRERNSELETANQEIEQMTATLKETYLGTLEALVAALDARDRETYGHSTRVAQLTMVLAREIGMEEGTKEWADMERGALLHDVGKIGVSDAILRKPGALTDTEWADMRQHARIGAEMLKDVPFLAGASSMIAAHHERWDGRGYPRGLKGEEIPLGARLFMLADTFDAMATDRPYRKARPYQDCLAEIVRCAGTQFDPAAVEALYKVYPQWVELHRQGIAKAADEERLSIVA
jgi:putative nucleotidyltransferase with HDIG domain